MMPDWSGILMLAPFFVKDMLDVSYLSIEVLRRF